MFFVSSRRRHTSSLCDWSSDCALPIFALVQVAGGARRMLAGAAATTLAVLGGLLLVFPTAMTIEIGRASCRERVLIVEGVGTVKGNDASVEEVIAVLYDSTAITRREAQ